MECSVCGYKIVGEPAVRIYAISIAGETVADMNACERDFCVIVLGDVSEKLISGGASARVTVTE